MKSDTIVTAKGQVTIPKHIRDRRGIRAGTRLEVIEEGDQIVLRKAGRKENRQVRDKELADYLERVRGTLNLGMSTDEYMEFLRGE